MKKFSLLLIALISLLPGIIGVELNSDSLMNKVTSTDSITIAADEFRSALTDSYLEFDSAKTIGEMIAASNRVKLIASNWNNQWIAQYYAGYMLSVLSYIEKDASKRDAYIDEAESFWKSAHLLYKKNYDEMFVLAAMISNARLAVKPGSRYKKYGELFNANIDSAKNLNSANPRIYFLQGNSVFYTPKLFGGGAKKALPYFEKADTLFQNEKTTDIFSPYWGKKQNEKMLTRCKE